jgi:putative endonuclease
MAKLCVLRSSVEPKAMQNEAGLITTMYVYLIKSKTDQTKKYVGRTENLAKRLKEHNAGKSLHTSKYVPWELVVSIDFADSKSAVAFEKYLKHGSGHAFAKRHFW